MITTLLRKIFPLSNVHKESDVKHELGDVLEAYEMFKVKTWLLYGMVGRGEGFLNDR